MLPAVNKRNIWGYSTLIDCSFWAISLEPSYSTFLDSLSFLTFHSETRHYGNYLGTSVRLDCRLCLENRSLEKQHLDPALT